MELRLRNEEIRSELPNLLNKVKHLVFLTCGQCFIFDNQGEQIGELQYEFGSGEPNMLLLKQIADHAEKHSLGRFREWMQDMNKEDFMTLTHLNTVE